MQSVYQQIMRSYELSRDQHARALDQRKREVYEKLPRIKALDVQIAQIGVELVKTVFSHPESAEAAAKEIRFIAEKLKQEKAILLSDNNFPIDYLEMGHDCHLCHDTGFKHDQKRCTCYHQKLAEFTYEMSNIKDRLSIENFEHYDENLFSSKENFGHVLSVKENMKGIKDYSQAFVQGFHQTNGENLLFYGHTGLGKTFMCSCIAKGVLDKRRSVIYQTAFKLMDMVQRYKFSDKQDKRLREAYDLLFSTDLLIIDDLGTEMINSFTQTELFNIINSRLLANKKMVISTNMSLIELSKAYGERISSRIIGHFEAFEFYGDDLRLR